MSPKNASFGWAGLERSGRAVLSYIDLDLQAGQLIAITGPGVSVKTLLLKGLLGEVAQ